MNANSQNKDVASMAVETSDKCTPSVGKVLPVELICQIFLFVDPIEVHRSVNLVCKSFYASSRHCYYMETLYNSIVDPYRETLTEEGKEFFLVKSITLEKLKEVIKVFRMHVHHRLPKHDWDGCRCDYSDTGQSWTDVMIPFSKMFQDMFFSLQKFTEKKKRLGEIRKIRDQRRQINFSVLSSMPQGGHQRYNSATFCVGARCLGLGWKDTLFYFFIKEFMILFFEEKGKYFKIVEKRILKVITSTFAYCDEYYSKHCNRTYISRYAKQYEKEEDEGK